MSSVASPAGATPISTTVPVVKPSFKEMWAQRTDVPGATAPAAPATSEVSAPVDPAASAASASESVNESSTEYTESIEHSTEIATTSGSPSSKSNKSTMSNKVSTASTEKVRVKGVDNQSTEITIDYTDRNKIRDAYLRAAGMRKFQQERDAANKKLKESESLQKDWDRLETAFSEGGLKGLAMLLGKGTDKVWREAVDAEMQEREARLNMDAEERAALEQREREAAWNKRLSDEQGKRAEFEKQIRQERERAALSTLEAKLHPAFDRYRFAGKLNDPDAENSYDEAIWTKAQQQLERLLEKSGQDISSLSQAVIDREFRLAAAPFVKHASAQATKAVSQLVDKKKQDAMKKVQAEARKGLGQENSKTQLITKLKAGDLRGALSMWHSGRN